MELVERIRNEIPHRADDPASPLRIQRLNVAVHKEANYEAIRGCLRTGEAEVLINTFIDSSKPLLYRREVGSLILELLNRCKLSKDIRSEIDLGAFGILCSVFQKGAESETIKLISGLLLRALLIAGVSDQDIWTSDTIMKQVALSFPTNFNDDIWIADFHAFLDKESTNLLTLKRNLWISFPIGVHISDASNFTKKQNEIQAICECGSLTIVITPSANQRLQYIDIPITHLQSTSLRLLSPRKASSPSGMSGLAEASLQFVPKATTYNLNLEPRSAKEISLVYRNVYEAKEAVASIEYCKEMASIQARETSSNKVSESETLTLTQNGELIIYDSQDPSSALQSKEEHETRHTTASSKSNVVGNATAGEAGPVSTACEPRAHLAHRISETFAVSFGDYTTDEGHLKLAPGEKKILSSRLFDKCADKICESPVLLSSDDVLQGFAEASDHSPSQQASKRKQLSQSEIIRVGNREQLPTGEVDVKTKNGANKSLVHPKGRVSLLESVHNPQEETTTGKKKKNERSQAIIQSKKTQQLRKQQPRQKADEARARLGRESDANVFDFPPSPDDNSDENDDEEYQPTKSRTKKLAGPGKGKAKRPGVSDPSGKKRRVQQKLIPPKTTEQIQSERKRKKSEEEVVVSSKHRATISASMSAVKLLSERRSRNSTRYQVEDVHGPGDPTSPYQEETHHESTSKEIERTVLPSKFKRPTKYGLSLEPDKSRKYPHVVEKGSIQLHGAASDHLENQMEGIQSQVPEIHVYPSAVRRSSLDDVDDQHTVSMDLVDDDLARKPQIVDFSRFGPMNQGGSVLKQKAYDVLDNHLKEIGVSPLKSMAGGLSRSEELLGGPHLEHPGFGSVFDDSNELSSLIPSSFPQSLDIEIRGKPKRTRDLEDTEVTSLSKRPRTEVARLPDRISNLDNIIVDTVQFHDTEAHMVDKPTQVLTPALPLSRCSTPSVGMLQGVKIQESTESFKPTHLESFGTKPGVERYSRLSLLPVAERLSFPADQGSNTTRKVPPKANTGNFSDLRGDHHWEALINPRTVYKDDLQDSTSSSGLRQGNNDNGMKPAPYKPDQNQGLVFEPLVETVPREETAEKPQNIEPFVLPPKSLAKRQDEAIPPLNLDKQDRLPARQPTHHTPNSFSLERAFQAIMASESGAKEYPTSQPSIPKRKHRKKARYDDSKPNLPLSSNGVKLLEMLGQIMSGQTSIDNDGDNCQPSSSEDTDPDKTLVEDERDRLQYTCSSESSSSSSDTDGHYSGDSEGSSQEAHEDFHISEGDDDEENCQASLLPHHRILFNSLGCIMQDMASQLQISEQCLLDLVASIQQKGQSMVEKTLNERARRYEESVWKAKLTRRDALQKYKILAEDLDHCLQGMNERHVEHDMVAYDTLFIKNKVRNILAVEKRNGT